MSPSEFQAAQARAGWLYMAQQAFDLTPGETYALDLLSDRPGVPVSMESLQAYSGKCSQTQSKLGAVKRIERLRAKLADVGCDGVISLVTSAPNVPAIGYCMSAAGAQLVRSTLFEIYGVELAA